MKYYYEAEIITTKNKTTRLCGWFEGGTMDAIKEIEQNLERGSKVRSIERFMAKGVKK